MAETIPWKIMYYRKVDDVDDSGAGELVGALHTFEMTFLGNSVRNFFMRCCYH